MDGQSLLQTHPVTESTPINFASSSSSSSSDSDDDFFASSSWPSTTSAASNLVPPKKKLRRSRTAPALVSVNDLFEESQNEFEPTSLVRQASFLLVIYLSLGVTVYYFNRDHFSGTESTYHIVDALYFCIVTMCTIGYGDIAPITPFTKLFACVFVLVGFGFIDILLSGVVNHVLDLQENLILSGSQVQGQGQGQRQLGSCDHKRGGFRFGFGFSACMDCIVDVAKGRMRIRLKVGLALGVVLLCIGLGSLVLYFFEHLDGVDSVYLAVMSVTTVGYGDRAFKTLPGRLFASIWLLVSTLAVARAFLYLAEARIDKRHRRLTNWVLQREITIDDLLAADINNNGYIRKSEYVIYKLKEMGKISEKDVKQICNQFNKLDESNSGKITLHSLLQSHL
ncbi:Two-pore potassium channel 3 [Capsicum chinense]|nr:Two-pore potassium channel 3 [Capsicum chinense]